MEMPLKGFPKLSSRRRYEGQSQQVTWKVCKIRLKVICSMDPKNLFNKKAVLVSGNALYLKRNAQWFSAVGYYYAQMMNKKFLMSLLVLLVVVGEAQQLRVGYQKEFPLKNISDIDLSLKQKKRRGCSVYVL